MLVEKRTERLPTHPLYKRGEEQVAGVAVREALTGGKFDIRRIVAEDVEHRLVGDRLLGIGVFLHEGHVVGQAAGVVQQLPHGDGRVVAQLAQVGGDWLVQVDPAPLGQQGHGGGGKLLAHRGQLEDGVGR